MHNDADRLQFEGKFDQFKGRIKEAWGVLSDDELDRTEGKWDRVVGTIKEKTGDTAEAVEQKLHDILSR
ncbi:MAG TPA: CsbD family protein [Actinomycetota bacterium]|nr:CsbD family protein [Actinomycetota bacterium]